MVSSARVPAYLMKDINELRRLIGESIWAYNEIKPHLSLVMNTPSKMYETSQQLVLLAYSKASTYFRMKHFYY